MKERQKTVIEKEMNHLGRWGIIKKELTRYSSPVLLVQTKHQMLYRACTDF